MSMQMEPAAAPAPGAPGPLAPAVPGFGAGSVLSRAFSVWARNFPSFTAVAILFALPALLVTALGPAPEESRFGTPLARFLGNVLTLATTGALTHGVLQALDGREVRLGAMLATGVRKLGKLFLVSLGVGLLAMFGLLLLVVPGLIALCAFWVAAPVAVAEQGGAGEAMSRSATLTQGYRWPVLAALLVTFGAALALAAIAGFGVGFAATVLAGPEAVDHPAVDAIIELLSTVASGFLYAAPAVAYHDLRVLKEGVDTGQLSRVFD